MTIRFPLAASFSSAALGSAFVWVCAAVFAAPAQAACVQSGSTVECADDDGDGFMSPQTLTVHIRPNVRIQNLFTNERIGICPLSFPAIEVGASSAVTNEGLIGTFGVCGFGISAGRNSSIVNAGSIRTHDIISHGILVDSGSVVRNSAIIVTQYQGSSGIFGVDNVRVIADSRGSITTNGAGSNGIEVGARGSVTHDGIIVANGDASAGINAGVEAVILNSGSIQTTANNSAGIRALGGRVTNSGRIQSILSGPAFSLTPTIGVSVSGNEASFTNTGSGIIEATHIGVTLAGASGTTFNNEGRIETSPARQSDGTLNVGGGAVILGGSSLASFTNSGTIISNGGPAAVRTLGAPVTFSNSGTIVGDIVLSARDDSISLHEGSNISGTLQAGAGTDSVILHGRGALGSPILNAEYLSKSGNGDWVITHDTTITEQVTIISGGLILAAGTRLTAASIANIGLVGGTGTIVGAVDSSGRIAPGTATTKGTLTINGAFRQSATGVIAMRLSPDGTSDRLVLSSPATLAGTLALSYEFTPGGASFQDGQRFEVLTPASGTLESAGQITLDAPKLRFLNAALVKSQNGAFSVEIDRLSYETAAETPTQASVGRLFDQMRSTSSPLRASIDQLESADAETATAVLADFAPEAPGGMQTLNLLLLDRFADGLRHRGGRTAPSGSFAWARGFTTSGHSRGIAVRGDYGVDGLMAGVDMNVGTARVGVAAARADSDFTRGTTSATSDASLFALTAAYGRESVLFDASVAYGTASPRMQRFHGRQSVHVAPKANLWSASVRGTYAKSLGPATVLPHAGISYHRAHLQAFSENVPLGVMTDGATANSLRARFGVGVETNAGRFRPFGDLSVSAEILSTQPRIAAALIGVPNSEFDLYSDARRRVAVEADAGVAVTISQGLEFQVTGGLTANDLLAGRRISAGLTYRW